jgi:hypothetical protein
MNYLIQINKKLNKINDEKVSIMLFMRKVRRFNFFIRYR